MKSPYPVYVRYRQGRVVAGVANGLAGHLGVDVLLVRLVLMFTMLLGGIGVLFYSLMWISTKLEDTPAEVNTRKSRKFGSVTLVALGLLGRDHVLLLNR